MLLRRGFAGLGSERLLGSYWVWKPKGQANPTGKRSDRAELDGLSQALHGIPGREKLMGDETVETGLSDRLGNGWIIDLLGMVDFVSTGVTSGVVVSEVLMVVLDRADDIPFHDLHVVDVVEEFEMIASDLFA